MSRAAPTFRITHFLFLLGILLGPFIFWPTAPIPFEIPKVWYTIFWVVALAVVYTGEKVRQPFYPTHVRNAIMIPMLLFFGWICCTAFLGADFQKSLLGNPYRRDGLITLSSLLGCALIIAMTYQHQFFYHVCRSIGLSTVMLSFFTLLNTVLLHSGTGWLVPNWFGVIGLTFGQPNFLAGYFVCTLPVHWYLYQRTHARLCIASACLQCVALVCTLSWGGIAGIGLFLCFVLLHRFGVHPRVWIVLTLCWIACFWGVSILKDRTSSQADTRYRIYSYVFQAARQRPLSGWGLTNTDYAFRWIAKKDGYIHDIYVDKAHSEWLEIFVTSGVIGSLLYFFWISNMLGILTTQVRQSPMRQTLLMLFLLYLYHAQTNVISISEHLLFWVVVGFSLAIPRSTSRRDTIAP